MSPARRVHRRLAALLLVTLVGGAYVLVEYVDLPRLVGHGRYTVSVELPDTGGLYAESIVTYRGREVGQVDEVALTDDGIVARLSLVDDVRVPRDLDAAVRSTSALGEQYLDLRPRRGAGPTLADGDVVARDRARMPTPTAATLESVNALVETLPAGDLAALLDETHAALAGSSTDLAALLDSSRRIVDTTRASLDPALRLVTDLPPVLATQQRSRGALTGTARDLAAVTEQLRDSDDDLRGVIAAAGPLAAENRALLADLRPRLPGLLANSTATSRVTSVYRDHLGQILTIFPMALNQFQTSHNGSGAPDLLRANLRLVLNDPPPCTTGYPGPAARRDPQDLSPRSAAVDTLCREPTPGPIGVRMARNGPCPEDSPGGTRRRSPDARGCGLAFQSPQEERAQRAANVAVQDDVAARNPRHRGEPQLPPGPGSPALPDPGAPSPDG